MQNNRYWSISYTEFSSMMYKFGALSAGRIHSALFYAETVNYDGYVRQIPKLFFRQLAGKDRVCGLFQQDSAAATWRMMSSLLFSSLCFCPYFCLICLREVI
jgi:hypothetical protein